MDDIKVIKRQRGEYKKALTELSLSVSQFIKALDAEMKQPSSPKRGENIAKLSNALDLANDKVRYFNLGIDYRKDKK